MDYEKVFSEFEVKDTSLKFEGDEAFIKAGCVGSMDETLNAKNITKKCEGVVVKNIPRGDGTGELALSLHMRYDLYLKTYGMLSDGLAEGVYSYGKLSRHNPFSLVCRVEDEDGVKKFKAYPNCIVTTGISRKIENGAEEVAEIELTVSIMPDETGQCMYEALESKLSADIKAKWMTEFTPDLVKVASA